jgi:hypothetical protein
MSHPRALHKAVKPNQKMVKPNQKMVKPNQKMVTANLVMINKGKYNDRRLIIN